MSVEDFIRALEGYNMQQEMESSRFRRIYTVIYNAYFKPKRTEHQLWPLHLLDKGMLGDITSTDGKIAYLRNKGFAGELENIERKELEWLRKTVKNLWGPPEFFRKGESLEGNKQKVMEFCTKYKLTWQEDK
jgi:hypothetical protein